MSDSPSLTTGGRVPYREKKPRFTPGPYHVSGSGPRMHSIKSAGGRTLAYVLFSPKREPECEATARLLAAAPDLLLELRSLVSRCPCLNYRAAVNRTDHSKVRNACVHCDSARAAIAKLEVE